MNSADSNHACDVAMAYLARREHGAQELADKLMAKGFACDEAVRAVAFLRDKGWQSDERFAESLLRSRLNSGYGPYRIERELLTKGIDQALVHALLHGGAIDWAEQARSSYLRRFGSEAGRDILSRQKQQRYLLYKGFSLEHIKEVLNG